MLFLLPCSGGVFCSFVVVGVMCGRLRVTITPAEVPTQSMSFTAMRAVTLRQAVLCCRIMSSQPDSILDTAAVRLISASRVWEVECSNLMEEEPCWAIQTPRPASTMARMPLFSLLPTAIVSSTSLLTGLSILIVFLVPHHSISPTTTILVTGKAGVPTAKHSKPVLSQTPPAT